MTHTHDGNVIDEMPTDSSLSSAVFQRASYIHSKLKQKGACKSFWKAEKRVRYVSPSLLLFSRR